MENQPEIKLNAFQINVLLNDEEKETLEFMLDNNNVFCSTCLSSCKKGVDNKEYILDSRNDIMIEGNCKVCNGNVCRIIEFGENPDFNKKANDFRKSVR